MGRKLETDTAVTNMAAITGIELGTSCSRVGNQRRTRSNNGSAGDSVLEREAGEVNKERGR